MSKPRRPRTRTAVGLAIAKTRKQAGLTQDRLANRLNRYQSYVANIELGTRDVSVREFMWIVLRIGADPLKLLERICRDDDFADLYRRVKHVPKRGRRREREQVETYDPADEAPDDDESELGHLSFGSRGAK